MTTEPTHDTAEPTPIPPWRQPRQPRVAAISARAAHHPAERHQTVSTRTPTVRPRPPWQTGGLVRRPPWHRGVGPIGVVLLGWKRIITDDRDCPPRTPLPPWHHRFTVIWTLAHGLLYIACVIGLYLGGIATTSAYNRSAARGDTDMPAPEAVPATRSDEPPPLLPPQPVIHITGPAHADTSPQQPTAPVPTSSTPRPTIGPSRITRVQIPSIAVDAKVIAVGWTIVDNHGQPTAAWRVAEYAVGHHQGSGNPGDNTNIVLAGHVGGFGFVFRDLFYVKPGESIIVYTGDQPHPYRIDATFLVTEAGVSTEQRAHNARLIAPTDHEQLTLITCWPATGPTRFTQRVIVQASPARPHGVGQHSRR